MTPEQIIELRDQFHDLEAYVRETGRLIVATLLNSERPTRDRDAALLLLAFKSGLDANCEELKKTMEKK